MTDGECDEVELYAGIIWFELTHSLGLGLVRWSTLNVLLFFSSPRRPAGLEE